MLDLSAKKNIRNIYYYNFLWTLFVLLPVIVPFFESYGLTMEEIYQVQGFFSAMVFILEIPSGYLSDLLDRKKCLMIAAVFHGIGFTLLPFVSGMGEILVCEFFMAVGMSLFSGTDVSLLYDSLEEQKIEASDRTHYLGELFFYRMSGESVGALIASVLIMIHPLMPVWAQAVIAWLPLIPSFFIIVPKRSKMKSRNHRQNIQYIFRKIFKNGVLLRLIVLNNMFYGAATLIAVWTFQKYWNLLGVPMTFFGLAWFASNIVVAIVGKWAPKLEKKWGPRVLLGLMGLLPILGYFSSANMTGQGGVFLCLFFSVARGINQVIMKNAINNRVSADMRATANSITSLGLRLIFILAGPLMGYLMDHHGHALAFRFFGYFYILVYITLLLPLLKYLPQKRL